MKRTLMFSVAASLLLFSMSTWSATTKEEVQELKAQVAAMQKDVAEIKKLLQEGARAPAPGAAQPTPFKEQVVNIGSSPVMGKADAPVTMIEYSDYQCPFCARHYREVMPTLIAEYVDTGKLKFIMRENPIESIHANAANASMAALCAHDQGKYWEMHNQLFDNQRSLAPDNLKEFAVTLGLDTAVFNECLDSKKYFARLNDDIASGTSLGVRGTPGFFLGLTDKDDPQKANIKQFIKGAQSLDNFKLAIDQLLESAP